MSYLLEHADPLMLTGEGGVTAMVHSVAEQKVRGVRRHSVSRHGCMHKVHICEQES